MAFKKMLNLMPLNFVL